MNSMTCYPAPCALPHAPPQMSRPVYFASSDMEEILGGIPRTVVLPGAALVAAPVLPSAAVLPPAPAAAVQPPQGAGGAAVAGLGGSVVVCGAAERVAVALGVDVEVHDEDKVVVMVPQPA